MKTMICTALAAALLLAAGPATAQGFGIDPMGMNSSLSPLLVLPGEPAPPPPACEAELWSQDPDVCPPTLDQGIAIDPNGGWLDSFGAWFAGLFS